MIKRLARCVREYKKYAFLSPLCMVGEVAMEVLIPLVMADLYDYGIVLQDMTVVLTKSLQLVILALASLCFGVASAWFASRAAAEAAAPAMRAAFHSAGFQARSWVSPVAVPGAGLIEPDT